MNMRTKKNKKKGTFEVPAAVLALATKKWNRNKTKTQINMKPKLKKNEIKINIKQK